jgi:nicotinate-nucleotide adenylyltransferase
MCEFIAAFRPGIDREVFVREINSLQDNYSAKIHMVETPVIDISSTDIRKRICDNKTIKYLVPESIEDYIRKFGLYKNLY